MIEGMDLNLIDNMGIRVFLTSDYPVVCETLGRMGIINHKKNLVYPSCYCIKTQAVLDDCEIFTIVHFKELFALQGKESILTEHDYARLRTIVYFLDKWRLVEVVNLDDISEILQEKIAVLPYKDKNNYEIIHKFKGNKSLFEYSNS